MRNVLITIAMLSAIPSAASATVVLSGDSGGKMEEYVARFQQVRASGESVVIDGNCMSACTMVLGFVPPNRVCVTENAVLGFHAAWMYDRSGNRVASSAGTRDLIKNYPPSVRNWISRNGGLRPEMMLLKGAALAAIVKPCDADGTAARRTNPGRQTAERGNRKASFNAR